MKSTIVRLCLLAGINVLAVSAAAQGIPDVSNCSAWTAATEPVSLMNWPDGTGTPLTSALTFGGGTTDATITVELRDALGFPVVGYQPCAIQLGIGAPTGNFVTCVIDASPDGPTDANGQCTFTGPIAAGGYDDSGSVVVLVAGEVIPGPPLDIWFNSPDLNADLIVNLSDTQQFTAIFVSGLYDYRIDYDFDGVITPADQGLFVPALGTACGVPLPPDPTLSIASIPAYPGPVSVYNNPDGSGLPLTNAFFQDGTTVDATITVTLLDGFGNPVIGYPAECLSLAVEFGVGNFVMCPGGVTADGPTDFTGTTSFSGPLPAGGSSENDFVIVKAGGIPITGSLDLWFNSPDVDGDLDVDADDETLFMDDYFGTYDYRSDYVFDGVVNLSDLPIFSAGYHPQNLCAGNGTVIVNPDPDFLNAGWLLTGPEGFSVSGVGDATFTDLTPGEYLLDWGAVPCWTEPSVLPEVRFLEPNGTVTFDGLYVEAGTVIVDAEPPQIAPTWRLTGPAPFSYDGVGDETLTCLPAGTYTMEWFPVSGWILPCPDPIVMDLDPGGTLEFNCTYLEAGTIVIDPEPNLLDAPWHLAGPGGYEVTGTGDRTLLLQPVGLYTLTWGDVPYWVEPLPNPASQVLAAQQVIVFAGEYETLPEILSIVDVDNDQGRRVRISWRRCLYDAAADPVITAYGIYRRQDQYKGPLVVKGGFPRDSEGKLAGWDALGMIPARMDDTYHYVAETLCDSTIADGDCYSTFMISAITPDPGTFFDSRPDSGYSLDNLVPSVPAGLLVAYDAGGNVLSWQPNPEEDVRYYRVYRTNPLENLYGDCGPIPEIPTAEVASPGWTDGQNTWKVCYYVTAVDFAGNESEPTLWMDTEVTGVADDAVPRQYALHHNVPNPFNPTTTITYDLPRSSAVRLVIYDAAGRRVRELVAERNQEPGQHRVVWRGRDQHGAEVAAGVYFYHLEAGDYTATERMVFLK